MPICDKTIDFVGSDAPRRSVARRERCVNLRHAGSSCPATVSSYIDMKMTPLFFQLKLKGQNFYMKMDRLIGIITILCKKEKVTAPYLAEHFEVSRRTIQRDIDALCMAGIPIVTAQGQNGGISVAEGFRLSKNIFNADELSVIIAGIRGLKSISAIDSRLDELLMKITPEKGGDIPPADNIYIDLSSNYSHSLSEKIALIKKAVNERRLISFDYYYSKGEVRRVVEPYLLTYKWSSWYVVGWCSERHDFRIFKLNRLWALSVTDDKFSPREVPEDMIAMENIHTGANRIELLIDKSMRFRLIEDYGPDCYSKREDGLFLTLSYDNKEFILSWLLGFGDKAKIISPDGIKQEYIEIIKNILRVYEE